MTLFVSYQRDAAKDEITPQDVCSVGTVVKITQIAKLPSNNLRVSVRGLYRAKAEEIYEEDGCFYANVSELKSVHGDPVLEEAYLRTAQDVLRDIASSDARLAKEGLGGLEKITDADEFIGEVLTFLHIKDDTNEELF